MTIIVMNVHNIDFFSEVFMKNFRRKNQKWAYQRSQTNPIDIICEIQSYISFIELGRHGKCDMLSVDFILFLSNSE